VFGLRAPEPHTTRDDLFRALNTVPRLTITLGHNVPVNMAALSTIQ
jgi:hypothetical protein